MANVSLATLRDNLKESAFIHSTERITDPHLDRIIVEAVPRHNPAYSITAESSTVPAQESRAVVLLSWHDLQRVRAAMFATQPSTSAPGGFGTDRNTPFYKCMELAKQLIEDYKEACALLGLAEHAFSPRATNTIVADALTGVLKPNAVSPKAQPVALHTINYAVDGSTIELLWDSPSAQAHLLANVLFHATGSTPIADISAEGLYPGIRAGLNPVWQSAAQDRTGVRIELPSTVGETHRFLMVSVSRGYRHSHSNELYRQR